MAVIQAGTDGTFKTSTAEGRLLEVLIHLERLERSATVNPQGLNVVNASLNTSGFVYSGSFELPVELDVQSNGSIAFVAQPYLTSSPVNPGTNSPTFRSTRAERMLLEVLNYVQLLEKTPARNPEGRNYVQGTFNTETMTFSGTFTIPVNVTLNASGQAVVAATEYLQD